MVRHRCKYDRKPITSGNTAIAYTTWIHGVDMLAASTSTPAPVVNLCTRRCRIAAASRPLCITAGQALHAYDHRASCGAAFRRDGIVRPSIQARHRRVQRPLTLARHSHGFSHRWAWTPALRATAFSSAATYWSLNSV